MRMERDDGNGNGLEIESEDEYVSAQSDFEEEEYVVLETTLLSSRVEGSGPRIPRQDRMRTARRPAFSGIQSSRIEDVLVPGLEKEKSSRAASSDSDFQRAVSGSSAVKSSPGYSRQQSQRDLDSVPVPVKVSVPNKRTKNFSFVVRIQHFLAHDGSVSTIRFNNRGDLLATAGNNLVIRIWKIVDQRSLEQQMEQIHKTVTADNSERSVRDARFAYCSLRLIEEPAVQELKGHQADIKDMSWSPNNFLLSCANDNTVRLWHPQTSPNALRVIKHPHFVNCVAFHPLDEAVFVSGCAGRVLRLYNIQPTTSLLQEVPVRDMPTTVEFNEEGSSAIVGTINGQIKVFTIKLERGQWKLIYKRDQEISDRRGNGTVKINNVASLSSEYMVSCNDSAMRLYGMDGGVLYNEFRGHKNSIHLKVSLSADKRFALVGSEPSSIYIYEIGDEASRKRSRLQRRLNILKPEFFRADEIRLNCAQFCPLVVKPWAKPSLQAYYDTSDWPTAEGSRRILAIDTEVDSLRNVGRSKPKKPPTNTQGNEMLPAAGLFIVAALVDGYIAVFYNVGADLKMLEFLS